VAQAAQTGDEGVHLRVRPATGGPVEHRHAPLLRLAQRAPPGRRELHLLRAAVLRIRDARDVAGDVQCRTPRSW
jgi:hypothetical protein